jgi:hypothetical protein
MVRRKRNTKLAIILPLAFLCLIFLLILFNKSTVRNLVPIDYITDPWPTQQACPIPEIKK